MKKEDISRYSYPSPACFYKPKTLLLFNSWYDGVTLFYVGGMAVVLFLMGVWCLKYMLFAIRKYLLKCSRTQMAKKLRTFVQI